MKKSWVWMLCAALMVGALGGCGGASDPSGSSGEAAAGGDQTAERIYLSELSPEDYVTLGEYKGMTIRVEAASVDEDELEERMREEYISLVPAELGVTDRAVQKGDTVILDYEGKKDDVAFAGGTAQGASLTIGSHQFIDGFEDGLEGVMPGETVDLNLTFPDPYPNSTDLSGAEVVFTVTVQYIIPEMTDEVIAGLGQEAYGNVEQFRQSVYDGLYEEALEDYEMNVENAVLSAVIDNCTFGDVPQGLVDQYEESTKSSIESIASMFGVDGEYYTLVLYGMSLDDFARKSAEDSARQALAFQAIAGRENLSLSEEALEKRLSEYAASAGAESVDALLDGTDREIYREYFMLLDVMDFLKANNTVQN